MTSIGAKSPTAVFIMYEPLSGRKRGVVWAITPIFGTALELSTSPAHEGTIPIHQVRSGLFIFSIHAHASAQLMQVLNVGIPVRKGEKSLLQNRRPSALFYKFRD